MFNYKFLLLPVLMIIAFAAYAQNAKPPFFDEIQAFKKQDSLNPPAKGSILFTGSSSIQKWTNLPEMFPGYRVLNRGFGGSSLPHVLRYAEDIIIPYQPKQIVIYCGENDIASDTVGSTLVAERFKSLFRLIRQKLPGVPIVFISMKPSPSREKYLPVIRQGNQIIKNFLWQQSNVFYVDVYSRMLDAAGKPDARLFGPDMLHMNQEGYKIWRESLLPYLMRN